MDRSNKETHDTLGEAFQNDKLADRLKSYIELERTPITILNIIKHHLTHLKCESTKD